MSINMITYHQIQIQTQFHFKDKLCRYFKSLPFGRYLTDRKIDIDQAVSYEYDSFTKYLEKGSVFIAINNDREIIGLIGFHFSNWDTNIFHKRMAILQYFLISENNLVLEKEIAVQLIDVFHNWCKDNIINVVVAKLNAQYFTPILLLQNNGYIVYECITFKTLEITQDIISKTQEYTYRYAAESDMEQLKKIALTNTFKKSHFYLDSNFDLNKVEEMYARWIENALSTKQKIVIVEESKQIAGVFIYDVVDLSFYFSKKYGVWKFAAVDNKFRDKGIGMKLFKSTLHSCIQDGVDVIDSSLVEKNLISHRFHDKLGFHLANTMFTLHKWF